MTATVRFAPSPTGFLHIGNARTAVLNWLFARAEGGKMVLRLDDTDAERSSDEFAEAIVEDLLWLGLVHDETVRQSARRHAHEAAAERLKAAGRLYACYETDDELERKRKRQLLQGLPPVYDREGLELDTDARAALEAEGRRPYWRFRLDHETVEWDDKVRRRQTVDCASLSDPVLVRGDATMLYTLPSVVDDIDLDVSHVIRGEDHVSNTAVQIQLFRALGASPPDFAHHSLLVAANGGRLSKRSGAQSVRDLRAAGLEPMAIASYAATIGTSEPVAPFQRMEELVARFSLQNLSRSPARFDPEEVEALNARLLQGREHEDVRTQLVALDVGGGAPFWRAVRGNVVTLSDARTWWDIATGDITPVIDDHDYCEEASVYLPDEPWDTETFGAWTAAVAEATRRKGRLLYAPLRLALTGNARGPELAQFLPFIGRERALARLTAPPSRSVRKESIGAE